MIPKIIHYCWFGPHQKSEIAEKCIESWKAYYPDFDILEWNEQNTNKYQNKFYRDAYRKKKFAFVSDCLRAQVLNEYGGIYLDIDMLMLKRIPEELLTLDFFTADEVIGRPAYGFFGAIPRQRFIKSMVSFYSITEFNEFSPPVITHTFQKIINRSTILKNEIILSPNSFYPLRYEDRMKDYNEFVTDETYAVHLWDHSWKKINNQSRLNLLNNLGKVMVDFLFYGYSRQYFIRYFRGFSRQLYYQILGKSIK